MLGLIILYITAFAIIAIVGAATVVFYVVRPRRKTYARALAMGLPLEPGDLGLQAEHADFKLPDDHTTPGWIVTGKKPHGPTALILHGHRDARFGALLRANLIAPYVGHCVVFDWPAHGDCTAPWMTCGTREPDDAVAVLDALPDALRSRPVVLFGYSLGAQIAIKTAGIYPDRFAGVIADGPYRRWDTPIRMRMRHHRVPAWPFIHLAGLLFYFFGLVHRFDRVRYAEKMTAPMLILHGTDDRVCPLHEGKELADAAPSSTFVVIEGGQHNRLDEHDPDTYHAALSEFFGALS